MIKLILMTLAVFLVCTQIHSQQDTMSFTLDDAVTYALENNKTLQNARQDVQIANEQIKEARGPGLPKVDGTVDYMTNFNYEFELEFGAGSAEPPQIDFSLLDEGDYEVLKSINQMFGSSAGSTIVMEDQANANIQVSQLIFSGQYWIGLELARIGKTLQEKNLSITTLEVKEQVINAYHLILMTRELLDILLKNKENLEEIYKHTNNMYELGAAEQTDVDQIRISLSQLENSYKSMERSLQLNYNMFRFLLGIDSKQEIRLNDDLEHLLQMAENEILKTENLNVDNNPTYQLVALQEVMQSQNVKMQQWAYSPTLAGFYSYREKILTTSFDLSPKNAAGLTLNVPIFSGFTKNAQLSKAKIELDKVKRNKQMLEEQLILQDKQLTFELKNAYENYNTQKENTEVAQRLLNSIKNKYRQGLVSSLELTQANSNYLEAQSNYISSVLNLLKSKLAYDKLHNKI